LHPQNNDGQEIMKILILSSAFSGLTQRVQRELQGLGHQLTLHINLNETELRRQLNKFQPALVVCPFLTQRIPEDIWQQWACLVVHPGIEGDRGPSSLDWAIQEGCEQWGVTLLQADRDMDAGNIWGTAVFPVRQASKLSVYKREVSTAAVELIKKAVIDYHNPFFHARQLDYSDPKVQGVLRPLMKQPVRAIDWQSESTDTIINKLNAADTSPGIADTLYGSEVNMYGAVEETTLRGKSSGEKPGAVIAYTDEAICRATVDGAVWIRQLLCKNSSQLPATKLPAAMVLKTLINPKTLKAIPHIAAPESIDDIRVERRGAAAYFYFNCYNGAFSTAQCKVLLRQLQEIKQGDARFIVFMGGEDFWSNGIHLNCIEAAEDCAEESWQNINAIDDVVLEMINCPNQVTIAALRNNSGAGGSIMALACDEVIVREGTIHNPHYKSMGLYGSEYWTYLLPKKVGKRQAKKLMDACEPLLAAEAMAIGFADLSFSEDWALFHQALCEHVDKLCQHMNVESFLQAKNKQRQADEMRKPLKAFRQAELQHMRNIFFNPNSDYHRLRRNFVIKAKSALKVPEKAMPH
jgi:putative two-component system hydrogenase maturation factor HypX/HoxX